ncbi:hypothetical protein ACJ41O_007704 [Fusarium nematophilum]
MAISISQVSFEHHRHALGIAEPSPRISWRFDGVVSDWEQSAYDLQVKRGAKDKPHTHSFNSSQSLYVPWPEDPLESTEYAHVRARAHGQDGQPSTPWSDWVSVETGLLHPQDWKGAAPISSLLKVDADKPKRPVYFRKAFDVDAGSSRVQKARLYVTALGVYEAEINGERVGDRVLAPGFQSYKYRHVYDTYDVTELVRDGENAIGIVVGEGWYAGRLFSLTQGKNRNLYGDKIGPMSLLVVSLEDGTEIEVPSDTTWSSSFGPITDAQIYNGETYDSRLETEFEGWSTASFNDSHWKGVEELPPLTADLVPSDGPPVRRLQKIKPVDIFTSPSGKTIVDLGQNFAGWVRVNVSGPSATNLTLKHVEVLENGEISTRPLRSADPTDNFILNGSGPQIWEPRFTFHGFRYVQVENWPEEETPLVPEAITGVAIWSDMEQTGWFSCSDSLLNKFHNNVRWSMRSNFLHIPTDCPQRDERMGWTGDAHAFGPTSNFLYNTAGFWRSWHKDVWAEMQANSNMAVPSWVPFTPPDALGSSSSRTAIWGDVAVGNPFNIWRAFGDEDLLKEQYSQAKAWIDVGVMRDDTGLWNQSGFQFGDWLDPASPPDEPGQATTHPHLVADAYLIYMTELISNMSAILGEDEGKDKYTAQHKDLLEAFYAAWITDGKMANETQTAYTLGLAFDIFSSTDLDAAAQTLRRLVRENDYLVGTGFAATALLGHSMRKIGATSDFYRMLLQTRVPSWLYQVVQNGTTTWERWDSLLPNGTVNPGQMTSFNHYAFGSVADWMHQVIGGLAPGEPGWKEIQVAPVPGGDLTSAEARFVSGYGEVETAWTVDGEGFHLRLRVPPNSRAVVTMPNGGEVVEVGSGSHEFHDGEYHRR